MQTDIFDYPLDDKHIALSPIEPRENAKLMVIKDNQITHNHIHNLIDYFQTGDVIVLNNTKVIKARLTGVIITKGRTAQCQVTLHKHILLNDTTKTTYTAFVKGSKKLNIDDILEFKTLNNNMIITAKIISKDNLGQVHIQFNCNLSDLFILLDNIGTMPLPPYIEKHRHADIDDDTNYQTIFAEHLGSVAAPTASLHLTTNILQQIAKKGIKIAYVTLHVGGGTFLPVKSDTIDQHYMHSEIIDINAQNAQIINEAKQNGGRVICVGTTALRVVESVVDNSGILRAFTGETDIFIYPSYRFKICDILMTNFHLPKSTLFMLVCALCGIDMMKYAYKTAQEMNYRFFSYGDACLLHKDCNI